MLQTNRSAANMISPLLLTIVAVLVIWLTAITAYVFYFVQKYKTTGRSVGKAIAKADFPTLDIIQTLNQQAVRYVGLIRFNPFNDVGSDQSFAVAIMDGQKNGIVISSIHARNASRMYAKVIVGGKSPQHDLSQEEEKAITQALSKP